MTKKATKKAAKVVARKKVTTKRSPAKKKAKKKASKKKATKRPIPKKALQSKASGFKPGHQLWKHRLVHGRSRTYETPEQLIAACCEYFQWVEDHPLQAEIQCSFEGLFTHDQTPKMRAMTKKAMFLHLGISHTTWQTYSKAGHELAEVCEWASDVIYAQKFEGAAAGLLSTQLIMRDLGINDTSKLVTDDGKGGNAPIAAGPVLTLPDNGKAAVVAQPAEEKQPDEPTT